MMRWNRPNWLAILVTIGILLPASFVAAATFAFNIFIEATNFSSEPAGITPPVDTVLAAFEFLVDDSLLTNVEGFALDLAPTQAIVNFGAFRPDDFRANLIFQNGLGRARDIITQTYPTPGVDGLAYHYVAPESNTGLYGFGYSTEDGIFSTGEREPAFCGPAFGNPPSCGVIIVREQTSVSPS